MEAITRFADDLPAFVSARQWGCQRKAWFPSRKSARRLGFLYYLIRVYRCIWCGGCHLGNTRTFEERQARRAGTEA